MLSTKHTDETMLDPHLRAALDQNLCNPAPVRRGDVNVVAFRISGDLIGGLVFARRENKSCQHQDQTRKSHDCPSGLRPRKNVSMCCSMNASASSGVTSNCSKVVRQIAVKRSGAIAA